jgi:hypothetical protein
MATTGRQDMVTSVYPAPLELFYDDAPMPLAHYPTAGDS